MERQGPFGPEQYREKSATLAGSVLGDDGCRRFLDLALRRPDLDPAEVRRLTIVATSLAGSDRLGLF